MSIRRSSTGKKKRSSRSKAYKRTKRKVILEKNMIPLKRSDPEVFNSLVDLVDENPAVVEILNDYQPEDIRSFLAMVEKGSEDTVALYMGSQYIQKGKGEKLPYFDIENAGNGEYPVTKNVDQLEDDLYSLSDTSFEAVKHLFERNKQDILVEVSKRRRNESQSTLFDSKLQTENEEVLKVGDVDIGYRYDSGLGEIGSYITTVVLGKSIKNIKKEKEKQ